jgi:hypothetical protein
MKIIDIKKEIKERLTPICRLDENIILMETDKKDNAFAGETILNYFIYNLDNGEMSKIDTDKEKVVFDFSHQKEVEGEDAFYYMTAKKQLFLNEYNIYKINMESLKPDFIFKFTEEKRYSTFLAERINDTEFLVFFKEDQELTFEDFENMNYGSDKYGFDKGVLYNIETGKSFQINDTTVLKGLKGVFFITSLQGGKVIIYEENYIETFQKEQIYLDIHMHRISNRDKFYYHDRLRYIPVDKFIEEAEKVTDSFSFINIEDFGIEGYELFSGADKGNLFYQTDTFGKEDAETLITLNRNNLDKNIIAFKSLYEDEFNLLPPTYFYYLDSKEKYVFSVRSVSDKEVNIKEILHGKIDYTFDSKRGALKECIENRYLILAKRDGSDSTTVIDMENNNIKIYNRAHMVFDEYLILY